MVEAYKTKDKDFIAKVQKAFLDINAPMYEAMKKSQGELDKILTPEQKEKQQESRMTGWIKALTDPIQLSDEQMKKLKAAYGELAKTTDHEAMERKLPEVVRSALTAEQRTTIAKHRAMTYVKAMFARAKLTDEQMKSVEAMVDELAKDPNLKIDWQTYSKLAEKIRGLLTAEQKKALETPYRLVRPGASVNPAPGAGGTPLVYRLGERVGGGVRDSIVVQLGEGACGGVKSAAQGYIDSIGKTVNLTDAQKKAITVAIAARVKASQEFQAKNAEKLKALSAALTEAYKSKDKDAIAKAHKAIEALYAPMREAMKKSQSELDNVLTPEQREKLQKSRAAAWVRLDGAVSQLPGGGLRVIISEGGKDREALERRYKELSEKAARLAEEARRVKREAYEVHESLERQPRQPQGQVRMLMPGQPLNVRPEPAIQELRNQVQELPR